MSFSFNLARLPRIVFGAGRIAELPDLVARYGTRILVVTGANSFLSGPHWPALSAALAARSIEYQLITVSGEPSPELVDASVRMHAHTAIDCVLGIGGGSALDAAKAIAGLLKPGNSVMDHLEGVGPELPYTGPAKPFIAVPTTAGTGSEATTWTHEVPKLNIPMGLEWTDEWLMKVAEVTGKPIPASLAKERGRLVDMMTDSHTWLHGKKFALYGDPDFVMGMSKFLLELGAEPTHVLCNNGSKKWNKAMQKVLADSPYGVNAKTYPGADLWHMRSLVFTEKPDFLIGNSYGKFIQRDTLHLGKQFEVPLIRLGFPIFDRHHLHRMTTLGYEGAMYILTTLVNAVLERLDEETRGMGTTDYNYDLVR